MIFIIDIDTLNNKDIFSSNIDNLKGYNFCLVIQNKNFKDELCNACDIKINQLWNIFDSASGSEFKSAFNKTNNLLQKLENNNFKFSKFWKNVNNSQELPKQLTDNTCKYNKYRKNL